MNKSFLLLAVALTLLFNIGCSETSPNSKPTLSNSGDPVQNTEGETRLIGTEATIDGSPNSESTEQFVLPTATQDYLRDTELLVLVLNQDLRPVFRAAIEKAETEVLTGFLAPKFKAQIFQRDGDQIQHESVLMQTWNRDRHERNQLDGKAFSRYLAELGQQFSELEPVAFHVTTLKPVEHGNFSGRWIAQWDMHLTGRLKNNHPAEYVYKCAIQLARFSDEVASTKGWIEKFEVLERTQVESPGQLMEEITETTGIDVESLADNWNKAGPPYPEFTGGANLLDFDRDGRLDLLLTGEKQPILYRSLGDGRFEDVTRSAGLSIAVLPHQQVRGAIVADFDNDHFEDLVISIETSQKLLNRFVSRLHFAVYQNNGDGSFRGLSSGEHNLHEFWMPPAFIGVSVADYDRDGLIDLYLAKSAQRAASDQKSRWVGDQSSPEGVLLKNEGGWQFRDATLEAGMSGENIDTNTALWVDVEPDGDPDLFLANHLGPNLLWENIGDGKFKGQRFDEGFGGFSMGATAGDMDEDGDIDFYLANMYSAAGSRVMGNLRAQDYPPGMYEKIRGFITGNELIENRGTTNFSPTGVAANVANAGWSYGPSFVDLDGDGWHDIYSPAGYQSVSRGKPDT